MPDRPFVSSPSNFQILPTARLDEEPLVTLPDRCTGACSSYSSIESSADDGDVDAGERVGDWTISCKNEGRRGVGVYVF
jgi:hypothetical protein